MTAVAEKKKDKKADVEVLDNGTIVITEETATDGHRAPVLPDPKPGEPGFDWQSLYPGEKVFTYTHDDVTVGLAAISKQRQPSIGFLRSSRRKDEFEQVLDMVEFVTCPEALAILDDWVPTDLLTMWEKWSEWNRSSTGE